MIPLGIPWEHVHNAVVCVAVVPDTDEAVSGLKAAAETLTHVILARPKSKNKK